MRSKGFEIPLVNLASVEKFKELLFLEDLPV